MARSQYIVLARAVETTDLSVLGSGGNIFVARNFGFIYPFAWSRPGPAVREVEVRGECRELYRWDQFFTTDWRDHVPFNIFINPDTIELWEKWTFADGTEEAVVKARNGSAFQPQFNCRDRPLFCQAGISSQGLSLGANGKQTVVFEYLEAAAEFPTDHLDDPSGSYADSDGDTLEAKIVREASAKLASVAWNMSGPFRPRIKVHVVTPDLKPFDDLKYRIVVGRHTVKDFGASDAAKNALTSAYVIEASGQYDDDHDFGMIANSGGLQAGDSNETITRAIETVLPRVQVQVNQDGYEEEAVAAPSANAWEFAVGQVAFGQQGLARSVQVLPRFHAAAGVRGFDWRRLTFATQVALPSRSWSSLGPDGSVLGDVLTAGAGGCVFRWTLSPETQIMPYRWLRLSVVADSAGTVQVELWQEAAGARKRYDVAVAAGPGQYWIDLLDPDQVNGSGPTSLIDTLDISDAGTAAYNGRYAGINRLNNVRLAFTSMEVAVQNIEFRVRNRAEVLWSLQGAIGHCDYRDAFRKLGVQQQGFLWPWPSNFGGQQAAVTALQSGAWPAGWQPLPNFDTDTPMVVDEAGAFLDSLRRLDLTPQVFKGERYAASALGNVLYAYDGIGQQQMFGDGFVAEFIVVVGGVACATAIPPGVEGMEVSMPDPGSPAAFATGGTWNYETGAEGWAKQGIHKLWPSAVDVGVPKVEHFAPAHSPLVKDTKRFDTGSGPLANKNHLIHLYVGHAVATADGVHSCGDDHGNSWVVFKKGDEVWVLRYNDSTWDRQQFLVSDDPDHLHPKISSGVDENPWIVFDDGSQSYYTRSPDQGQTWEEPVPITAGTNPVPSDDRRDGYQYVAVWNDSEWECWRKRPQETEFTLAGVITDAIPESSTGMHVVTGSEWPIHFWGSDGGAVPRQFRSNSQGLTWEEI